jgi:thioredoxin 1
MAATEAILQLDDENFEKHIADGVTLVDFYADWCGPCRMLAPVFEQVAKEMHGKAKFGKVDADKAEKVAAAFRITSIPTLILFKDGEEVNRVVGIRDAQGLKSLVQSAL